MTFIDEIHEHCGFSGVVSNYFIFYVIFQNKSLGSRMMFLTNVMASDLTIEQLINKHAKSAGGFSAYYRWCTPRHFRASCVSAALEKIWQRLIEIWGHLASKKANHLSRNIPATFGQLSEKSLQMSSKCQIIWKKKKMKLWRVIAEGFINKNP